MRAFNIDEIDGRFERYSKIEWKSCQRRASLIVGAASSNLRRMLVNLCASC